MKRLIIFIALFAAILGPALCQTQNPEGFKTFVLSRPLASLPLSGNEITYVIQNGLSSQVTTSNFPILIAPNSISNTQLAQMPANTVKCNSTGSRGNAQDCLGFASIFGTITAGDIVIGGPGTGQIQDSGATVIKTYIATSDPGVSNDNTQGYVAGSLGVNTATGRSFIARSVSTGAAVWVQLGTPVQSNYIASNWIVPLGMDAAANNSAAIGNTTTTTCYPFLLSERATISQIGTKINTVGTTNIQLALYNSSATTRLPTTLISNTGNIADTGTGTVSAALGASQQLEAGLYWGCAEQNDATVIFVGVGATTAFFAQYIGNSTLATMSGGTGQNLINSVTTSQSFGTWGDLTSAVWVFNNNTVKGPIIFLLVASVP